MTPWRLPSWSQSWRPQAGTGAVEELWASGIDLFEDAIRPLTDDGIAMIETAVGAVVNEA